MGTERKIAALSRPNLTVVQKVTAALEIPRFLSVSFAIFTFKSI